MFHIVSRTLSYSVLFIYFLKIEKYKKDKIIWLKILDQLFEFEGEKINYNKKK